MTSIISRLIEGVESIGFDLRVCSSYEIGFVRRSGDDHIFHHVDILFTGARREFVGATAYLSVTRWIGIKGLSEGRGIKEVDEDPTNNESSIRNMSDLKRWLKRLSYCLESVFEDLTNDGRHRLLSRAEKSIRDAASITQSMHFERTIYEHLNVVQSVVSSEMLEAANKISAWPGVKQLKDADEYYLLASLSVLRSKRFDNYDLDPLSDHEFLWLLEIVVDLLLIQYNYCGVF